MSRLTQLETFEENDTHNVKGVDHTQINDARENTDESAVSKALTALDRWEGRIYLRH